MVKSKVNLLFGGVVFLIALVIVGGVVADMTNNKRHCVGGPTFDGLLSTSKARTSIPSREAGAVGARDAIRHTPITDLSYEAEPAFTGRKSQDACICYERAFLTSCSLIEARTRSLSRGDEYTSIAYISGYAACRAAVDTMGGNYWAHGWELGKEGKFWRAKCPAGQSF